MDVIAFTMQLQEQINWCWAAVAVSVACHYHSDCGLQQCALADQLLNQANCCQHGGCAACNVVLGLTDVLNHTGNLQQVAPHPMTFEELQVAVSGQRPLCARVESSEGVGHFVVVSGYNAGASAPWVVVEDPSLGQSYYPFQTFLTCYQGSWHCTHTYWTQP